jgi:NAD(P)-dependent dehydrogenase (short-subunit alcohol dehydrogenase family)
MSARPVALVTGARRGIGRAVATLFAENGFDLALADLSSDDLAEAAAACRGAGARVACVALDIADLDRHEPALDEIEAALEPIDCLVNNAGVSVLARCDLLEVTPESFDRCLAVNTRGTFFFTQAVAKRMLARSEAPAHRSIITVTSANAVAASIFRGEYCVSKAGLSMASKLFAIRLAEAGIGVYEIQPGVIATDMTAPVKARYDEALAGDLALIKRWGEPADVARVALTAAEGRLPYTAGQAIQVDGGLLVPRF